MKLLKLIPYEDILNSVSSIGRAGILNKAKSAIKTIVVLVLFLTLILALLQAIPMAVKYFHFTDMEIGRFMVYWMPVPVIIALAIIWRKG